MYLVIIKKVEGRWIVDRDSNHVFEGNGGANTPSFPDGVYQEIKVSEITPLRKHPNDPSVE